MGGGGITSNLKVTKFTFEEVKKRIQKLFSFQMALETSYKLCDYKPVLWKRF